MATCKCGRRTDGGLCRDCQLAEKWDDRFSDEEIGDDQEDEDEDQLVADGGQDLALVGTCADCGGRMVEEFAGPREGGQQFGLRCEACGETGKAGFGEDADFDDPDLLDGVEDVDLETVEWIRCGNCHGSGDVIGCYDDICHARGQCMHDGNDACPECGGTGTVPRVPATDGGQPTGGVPGAATGRRTGHWYPLAFLYIGTIVIGGVVLWSISAGVAPARAALGYAASMTALTLLSIGWLAGRLREVGRRD